MPLLNTLRLAPWLTRDRVMAWASVLLVLELAFMGFIAAWQHGLFFTVENPHSADYVSFYAAGKLALAGTPALAYDHAAHLLMQQQTTHTGESYQFFFYPPVFLLLCAPFAALPAPDRLAPPTLWPRSEPLESWALGQGMQRGAAVCAVHQRAGEPAALARLDRFLDRAVARYHADRDFPAIEATSGLSENLTWGEIGPRQIWHAGRRAMLEGAPGAEHFLRELGWREFAWSLMHHSPHIASRNWRSDWDDFPWAGGHAPDVCDRHDARARPDDRGLISDQASSDPLENRHGLVRRMPDRLGSGVKCHGMAMGCRIWPRCRALFPRLQPRASG